MSAAKQEVKRILDSLPEDASLKDSQYHIYVRQKIEHGLEDIQAGRTSALGHALRPDAAACARSIAAAVRSDGAQAAAQSLITRL